MPVTAFRGRVFGGLAVALAALPALAHVEAPDLEDWPEGPVRYIAEPEEIKAFRKLDTDAERALFIERFWSWRDPTPETLANEYRQMFWERVRDANRLFLDSHRPGWRTDRGKIYVLYGPPTTIEDRPDLDTGGLPAAGVGLIRWIYEGRPGGRADLNPVVVVPFVRDGGGEYRVSYDPDLASVFFDEQTVRNRGQQLPIHGMIEALGGPRQSELSVMLDLGRMQEVPPQSRILLERIETLEAYGARELAVAIGRYRHPEKPGVATVVTVDASHVVSGDPAVIARFVPLDATRQVRMLGEDSFRVLDVGGRRLAQGRLVLEPGEYELTVMAVDPATALTAAHHGRLSASVGTAGELQLSDVVLAEQLESIDYAALASYDEPYQVGPFRVVPRLDRTVRRGEPVKLFYEIYGGKPPLRVSYQLEGRDDDGSWVALGRPSTGEQKLASQAWELPTSPQWPLGEYRVRISIEDGRGSRVEVETPFRLENAESP
jgi:GWxTD domain-containing protein